MYITVKYLDKGGKVNLKRGTVIRKQENKEHGDMIVKGVEDVIQKRLYSFHGCLEVLNHC